MTGSPQAVPAASWRRETVRCLLAVVLAIGSLGALYGGLLALAVWSVTGKEPW